MTETEALADARRADLYRQWQCYRDDVLPIPPRDRGIWEFATFYPEENVK